MGPGWAVHVLCASVPCGCLGSGLLGEGLAHSAHLVPAHSFPLSDLMPLGSLQAVEKNRHFLNGKDCGKMLV